MRVGRIARLFSLFEAKPNAKYPQVLDLLINNPKEKNALSVDMLNEMQSVCSKLRDNYDVRAAVVRSTVDGTFCAGANLKHRLTLNSQQSDVLVQQIRRVFHMVLHLPFPVISLIDGWALGGGLELALNTDIRICTKRAHLGLVETKWAILPGGGGTQTLVRLVGPAIAKQLIFTARRVPGQDAQKLGLVNYCQQDGAKAQSRVNGLLQQILKNGPMGVRLAKNAINYGMETDLKTGLQIQRLNYYRLIMSQDRTQGMKAFIEKRDPVYKNK